MSRASHTVREHGRKGFLRVLHSSGLPDTSKVSAMRAVQRAALLSVLHPSGVSTHVAACRHHLQMSHSWPNHTVQRTRASRLSCNLGFHVGRVAELASLGPAIPRFDGFGARVARGGRPHRAKILLAAGYDPPDMRDFRRAWLHPGHACFTSAKRTCKRHNKTLHANSRPRLKFNGCAHSFVLSARTARFRRLSVLFMVFRGPGR